MTLEELLVAFREDMDDTVDPQYWPDTMLTRFANQAEMEAARRGRLIEDSETARDPEGKPLCEFALSSGDQFITLNRRVIQVKRVKLALQDQPLTKIHRADADRCFPGWQTAASASVLAYCSDFTKGKLYFINTPDTDDTVTLTIIREPLKAMEDSEDTPEIAARYHEGLINWMKCRALMVLDIKEKYDPVQAAKYESAFEAEFGKRSSAVDEVWIEREQQYDSFDGTF